MCVRLADVENEDKLSTLQDLTVEKTTTTKQLTLKITLKSKEHKHFTWKDGTMRSATGPIWQESGYLSHRSRSPHCPHCSHVQTCGCKGRDIENEVWSYRASSLRLVHKGNLLYDAILVWRLVDCIIFWGNFCPIKTLLRCDHNEHLDYFVAFGEICIAREMHWFELVPLGRAMVLLNHQVGGHAVFPSSSELP